MMVCVKVQTYAATLHLRVLEMNISSRNNISSSNTGHVGDVRVFCLSGSMMSSPNIRRLISSCGVAALWRYHLGPVLALVSGPGEVATRYPPLFFSMVGEFRG